MQGHKDFQSIKLAHQDNALEFYRSTYDHNLPLANQLEIKHHFEIVEENTPSQIMAASSKMKLAFLADSIMDVKLFRRSLYIISAAMLIND